jgi:hypothetical protein
MSGVESRGSAGPKLSAAGSAASRCIDSSRVSAEQQLHGSPYPNQKTGAIPHFEPAYYVLKAVKLTNVPGDAEARRLSAQGSGVFLH